MLLSKLQKASLPWRPLVLVVDDAPSNVKILAEMLKPECDIITCNSGEEGLVLLQEHKPDLILLDVVLPGCSGFEVCKILKSNPEHANIPVIFVTARDEMKDETYGFEVGAVDYLTKPIRRPIVRARVYNHLELKRHRDTLEKLSTLDGLTGIYNRRYFDLFLDTEWRRSSRSEEPISLIIADIDCFKKYNDRYGHLEGDECLKAVAHCLATAPRRGGDAVCRYGGEEFCIVLPTTRLEGALKIAESMRAAVQGLAIPHEENSACSFVTVSMGVSSCQARPGLQAESLLRHADAMLYRAKSSGRNRVVGAEMTQV